MSAQPRDVSMNQGKKDEANAGGGAAAAKTGMITGGKAIGTATTIGGGALLGAAALLGFTAYNMKKTFDFAKNLSQPEKDKRVNDFMGKGFGTAGMSEEEVEKFKIDHQKKQIDFIKSPTKETEIDKKSLGFVPVNSKLKSDALEKVSQESKDLKIKKDKGDSMVNINNSSTNINKNDSVNNYTPPVVDHSRILFRTGISG